MLHCSLVIARASNWHIALLTAHPYCIIYRSRNRTAFFSSSGCLAFWLWNARQLLFFSSRILFFAPVMNTTFAHIIFSSRCTVSNVFCFFDYPKHFFCREWAITRSCSHSLFNTWFALHSLMRDGIILFGGGAVPTLFQIVCTPQFFFTKFWKKYAQNICVYTVYVNLAAHVDDIAKHGSPSFPSAIHCIYSLTVSVLLWMVDLYKHLVVGGWMLGLQG